MINFSNEGQKMIFQVSEEQVMQLMQASLNYFSLDDVNLLIRKPKPTKFLTHTEDNPNIYEYLFSMLLYQ